MKKRIRKWTLRISATVLLIFGLLLIIVLNPGLSYANRTTHGQYAIYHQQALDPLFSKVTDRATELLQKCEWYRPDLRLDICLNDGSRYPDLIRKLRGPAFAWGFYDKLVLQGKMDCQKNIVSLNGYKWNLVQLIAHEAVHCLQYDHLGFWHSKPVASIPDWKWEGYAEYIARQDPDQQDLQKDMERLKQTAPDQWGIVFNDGSIAPRTYYRAWLLVKYCMEVKKMSYAALLEDQREEGEWWNELDRYR